MEKRIPAMKIRENLGRILEEIYYHGDEFIVERAGKPMAAMIPLPKYERWKSQRKERYKIYEQIKAKTKEIAEEKIDSTIDEAIRAARGKN